MSVLALIIPSPCFILGIGIHTLVIYAEVLGQHLLADIVLGCRQVYLSQRGYAFREPRVKVAVTVA